MLKLSVVIITKNEESHIRDCLESVKWADEIVIVDDHSTDRTVQICQQYTEKIYRRKMQGFGEQKQYGVERARGDWILSVDADEVITPQLAEEIQKVIQKNEDYDGYRIYRKSNYLGKWIRFCGWHVPLLRLFKREKGRFNLALVHEKVIVQGEQGSLKNEFLHYTYRDITEQIEKMNLFSTYDVEELIKKKVLLSLPNYARYFILKPVCYFLKKYLYLQGFREGIRGFFLSVFAAVGVFINYAKLWEKQKNRCEKH